MNQLIKIDQTTINHETQQTVSARDLHAFLEIGKDFSTWITDRIRQFDFLEGADFIKFPEIGESCIKPLLQYALTLDMAKELSMVERNTKGKEARQYFIECERIAKTIPQRQLSRLEIAEQLVESIKREEQLLLDNQHKQQQIEEAQPKVAFFNHVTTADKWIDMKEASKILAFINVGRNTLFEILRAAKVLDSKNNPYQHVVDKGYFKTVPVPFGIDKVSSKTVVSYKGLDWIRKNLTKKGFISHGECFQEAA